MYTSQNFALYLFLNVSDYRFFLNWIADNNRDKSHLHLSNKKEMYEIYVLAHNVSLFRYKFKNCRGASPYLNNF